MSSAEEIRESQRATWAGLSTSWEKWDAVIMAQLRPVGDAIVDALRVTDAQRHLDIASGTGEPGLTVARRAPRGHVTLTDLSPEMLAVARRRAEAQGITNVETQACSADDLPFADDAFDSVSVRFGYMFFPDAAAATAEIARVLRPGGRVAVSVWVRPEDNHWTGLMMRAIADEVELPVPDPDAPGMFRYAAPGRVTAFFEAAGLRDVAEQDVDLALVTASAEEYWTMLSEHMSLATAALEQVEPAARERIHAAVVAAARRYEVDHRVRVPGVARCVVGTK